MTQKVKTYLLTNSEIIAFQLINNGRFMTTQNSSINHYREAGNKIIELAERIKAERMNCLLETQNL